MTAFTQAVSSMIWDIKYRYAHEGLYIDQNIEDTWRRVAKAIAQAEEKGNRAHWEQAFYHILSNFQFLPGGRILAGAGTKHRVTLFNCFVMSIPEDSLSGIFLGLQEGALTLQQGGGVGYDFSVLRPQGEWIKKTGLPSSGPVSFMQIWDTTCSILQSTGARRGAMMGVMRCDHPDIEKFIAVKHDKALLRHFNLSVLVSDAFMKAVEDDAEWELIFPTKTTDVELVYRPWGHHQIVACKVYQRIRARTLWEKIIRSAYDDAEPGVLFVDTINRNNNLYYCENIHATNPCGEIPLPEYGACNLGAINLTQFIKQPFTHTASIDWQRLAEVTQIATRFLDNVIDVSHYPLRAQKRQAQQTRRIGLGVTGLADALVMLGVTYGEPDSLKLAHDIMANVADVTWNTSIELAAEKGVFPLYDKQAYLKGQFVQTLSPELQAKLSRHGVRNSHHNTIAPTGTISLLANNVSNGIEPIFSAAYTRHIRMTNGEIQAFQVRDYAHQLWLEKHQGAFLPAWVDIASLTPEAHLQMQAAMQSSIDNAISKTINIPADFPFEKLANVYTQAYQLGLKGCTIFRPNLTTGSVLETATHVTVDQCCQHD